MRKTCKQCQAHFEVTDQDQKFYDKISPVIGEKKFQLPTPTNCPSCRAERRLAFRNERTFYRRNCDLCKKSMVTVYAPDSQFIVYCSECWWGDKWDAMVYGYDLDLNRPFFEQFAELQKVVPRLGMINVDAENSEYCSHGFGNKDCYMTVTSDFNEKCLYGSFIWNSYECVDCTYLLDSKHCYECVDGDKLYECQFCQECESCSNCFGCYDCKNVTDSFGCYGLRHKQYCFLNEQLSESAYKKRLVEAMKDYYQAVEQTSKIPNEFPRKAAFQVNCDNCSGDHLKNCKNVLNSFDGYGGEDCKWIANFPGDIRDCYDMEGAAQIELSAECIGTGINSYRLFGGDYLLNGNRDELYCSWCTNNCSNLIGCIGLRKKQYCILNKQYSADEYNKLTGEIIKQLQNDGQFGEFQPITLSPFAYNETTAMDHFPLNKDQAIQKGYKWRDVDLKEYKKPTIEVPNSINDVLDSITDEILACSICKKNYLIIAQELEFYRRYKIPIPMKCHDCRHRERMAKRNPRKLWERQCMCSHAEEHRSHLNKPCPNTFQTTYSPERPESVYCEQCYLKEVY